MLGLDSTIAFLSYGNLHVLGHGEAVSPSSFNFNSQTLTTRAAPIAANAMGLGGHLASPSTILKQNQKINVQILSSVAASTSIILCLVVLYWFLLLQRNFRRTLVLLLILSDLFKSSWQLIFPAVSLARRGIDSANPFCDAAGFFIQMGLEACGKSAVIKLAVHR